MATVNEKMTALADKIRSLTGQTGKLSLDAMDTKLQEANDDRDAMITSLEELGVAVDANASLSDIASLLPTVETGTDTSDATATASDIMNGKTAYVNGSKITGTFTIDSELTTQDNLIEQIETTLAGKAIGGGGIDTSDATATAGDILANKTAYVDGEKITGTIATKTASDLTASGATVTVPAGYYANQATKSVASGSAKTPATTITKTPSISVNSSGLITASVSGTQNVTPTVSAGYVSSGTAGTITISGSATKQLTTQGAQTITPGTSNKTIASGRYLTGTQTIKGDANLIAGNIKKGVSIFGVTGTHEGGEDLEEVIAEQEALITELSTALDNKASGGGSVETCTVTINSEEEDNIIDIMYVSNTGIEETYMDGVNTLSIEAKKDSIIVVYGENINNYNSITTNGIEFKLTNAGDESTMYIFYATGDGTIEIA